MHVPRHLALFYSGLILFMYLCATSSCVRPRFSPAISKYGCGPGPLWLNAQEENKKRTCKYCGDKYRLAKHQLCRSCGKSLASLRAMPFTPVIDSTLISPQAQVLTALYYTGHRGVVCLLELLPNLTTDRFTRSAVVPHIVNWVHYSCRRSAGCCCWLLTLWLCRLDTNPQCQYHPGEYTRLYFGMSQDVPTRPVHSLRFGCVGIDCVVLQSQYSYWSCCDKRGKNAKGCMKR